MFEAEPTLSIFLDASLSRWGAVFKDVTTGMSWSDEEKKRHINNLEMFGAFNALGALADSRRNCTIELKLDNTSAVAYVNKEGGNRSASLISLALHMALWCEVRNIFFESGAFVGCLKFNFRQRIPQGSRLEQLKVASGGFASSIESLEDFGRPFR